MIKVERTLPPPPSLRARAARLQALAVGCYYRSLRRGEVPAREKPTFDQYKGNDVIVALDKLFHGKCAYCEGPVAKGARDVEHYRPKGKVDGAKDHDGYWWLALSWENLLPSCPGCNQGLLQHIVTPDMKIEDVEAMQSRKATEKWGKLNRFNVRGSRAMRKKDDLEAEDPLLIDPTRRDPEGHLQWLFSSHYSLVVGADGGLDKDPYGDETVQCCALNRIDLVKARTEELETLKGLEAQMQRFLDLARDNPDNPGFILAATAFIDQMKLHCGPKKKFAGMARAFVRRVERNFKAQEAARKTAPGRPVTAGG